MYDPNDIYARRRRGTPAIADGSYDPATAVPGTDSTAPPAVNTFQGRALTPAQLAQPKPQPVAVPAPVDPTQMRAAPAIAADAAGRIDSAGLNAANRVTSATGPGSNDAEILRRIEIAGGEHNGSPSARQAVMGALSGQLSASHAITAGAAQQQGQVFAQGAEAENAQRLSAQQDVGRMNLQGLEGQQQSALEDTRQTGETGRTTAELGNRLEIAKLDKAPTPTYQRGTDGSLALVDGISANPVKAADGTAFKPIDTSGEVTPKVRFDAYNDRLKAIEASYATPDEKQRQLAALHADPQFAEFAPGAQTQAQQPGAQAATKTQVPAGAKTATNPRTGERMYQDPNTGNWEPIQ